MPLIKKINNNYEFLLWEITESIELLLDFLKPTKMELREIEKFKTKQRRKQNIVSRILLNELTKKKTQLYYLKNGAPYTKMFKNISISHSKNYCGIICSEHKIGLDIQYKSSKINKLLSKFINAKEQHLIQEEKTKTSHFIWCAKEAIYKTLNTKCSFKENIYLNNIDVKRNSGNAYYHNQNLEIRYQIIFDVLKNYYIAIAINDRNL